MNNFFDDILSYRNQTLSGKALADFELELKNNPDLQKAVDEGGLIHLFQEELIEQDIQQSLEHVLKEKNLIKQSEKPTIMRRLLPFIVAASVVLCLGFAFLSIQYDHPNYVAISKEMLPIGLDRDAGLKGDVPSDLQAQSKTDKAIQLLKDNKVEAAKPLVQESLDSANKAISEEAQYLNMIMMFMEDKIEPAKSLAKKIANEDGHSYQNKASSFLNKVNKPWYILF